MQELHEQLYTDYYNKKNTVSSEFKIIALEGMKLVTGLRQGWGNRAVEAAWNAPDHQMLAAMELNIWNFASSKTEARLAAMSDLIINKEKEGINSFGDFRKLAAKRIDRFNADWLKTEYDTAVSVAQNSAAFARAWEQKDEFPFFQYQTVGDSNVRTSHAALNGKVFNLKDGAARRLWPPNDYGCRCEMIQLPSRVQSSSVTRGKEGIEILGDVFKRGEWNVNRAESKSVFNQKQRYSRITALKSKLENSNYKTYGMPTIAEISKGKTPLKLDTSITPGNVKELFVPAGKTKGGGRFMGFTDYLGRKMILKEKAFKDHTTKVKYTKQNRHQQFGKVGEVLKTPDEVWINPHEKEFNATYLKYYSDATIVVQTTLQNEWLTVETWYQLERNEKSIRKGLEIKRERS